MLGNPDGVWRAIHDALLEGHPTLPSPIGEKFEIMTESEFIALMRGIAGHPAARGWRTMRRSSRWAEPRSS